MKDFLILFCIIFVFSIISNKFGWGKALWTVLNKRIKPQHNFIVFVLFAIVWSIAVLWIYKMIGVPNNSISRAIMLGAYIALMPPLVKMKK